MKQAFKNISKWLMAVAMVSMVAVSCNETPEANTDDPSTDTTDTTGQGGQTEEFNIKISDVTANYSTVTFTVEAEGAKALAYTCVTKGETLTAKEVFEVGDATAASSGTFYVKGLDAETDYTLLVAINGTDGYQGPESYDFTTEANSGAPSSPEAAGIRVDNVEAKNFTWEITNGDDIDFSFSMVQPTIYIDNLCMEYAKDGISRKDAIVAFMIENAYLCQTTEGGGGVANYSYDECYASTFPIVYSDSRYSIFSIGCTGDVDAPSFHEFTEVKVQTLPLERTGDPQLTIECIEAGYIALKHKITPNADCKYWGRFFTQTSEINEFREYYDELEGEGMGDVRLTEYVKMFDPYVLDQTGTEELFMMVGWDQQGINFSRLALAFDGNLVPADKYEESIATTIYADNDTARYEMTVDSIGAGNFYLFTDFGENCHTVYWKLVDAGSMDEALKDSATRVYWSRTLWDEGWAEWRADGSGEGTTYRARHFVYGENSNHEFQLMSVSLNYGGTISDPVLSEPFTTLSHTNSYTDYPSVAIEQASVAKTNIQLAYIVEPDTRECDERLLYQRILQNDDPTFSGYLENSDEWLRAWMCAFSSGDWGGEEAAQANVWSVVRTDYGVVDPYHYYFNWAGMEPGKEFTVLWTTENGLGEMSLLKRYALQTATNDGGPNPELDVTLNSIEDVVEYDADNEELPVSKFKANATFTPNADVTQYYYLFIGENALTSYWYDVEDPEQLLNGIETMLMREGAPSIEVTWAEGTFDNDDIVYAACLGTGSNNISSKLTYVKFDKDGQIGEQVEVDITEEAAASIMRSNFVSTGESIGYAQYKECKTFYNANVAPKTQVTNSPATFSRPANAVKHSAAQAEQLEKGEVTPILTMKEQTLNALKGRR